MSDAHNIFITPEIPKEVLGTSHIAKDRIHFLPVEFYSPTSDDDIEELSKSVPDKFYLMYEVLQDTLELLPENKDIDNVVMHLNDEFEAYADFQRRFYVLALLSSLSDLKKKLVEYGYGKNTKNRSKLVATEEGIKLFNMLSDPRLVATLDNFANQVNAPTILRSKLDILRNSAEAIRDTLEVDSEM